jgi:hypothetical protein
VEIGISWSKRLIVCLVALSLLFGEQFFSVPTAEAVTLNFQWTGERGYSATAIFSYEEKTAPTTIAEEWMGQTQDLESLVVNFYNPAGKLMATYENVASNMAQGHYLQFQFNRETGQLVGTIDIGGEETDEFYLKGKAGENLSLYKVSKSGRDRLIDR